VFPADAAYSSAVAQGFVTDLSSLRFNVICTHAVLICQHCLSVHGPESGSVSEFRAVDRSRAHAYEGLVTWEDTYRGLIRVSLEDARCAINALSHKACACTC
jgi:hypothetical protein